MVCPGIKFRSERHGEAMLKATIKLGAWGSLSWKPLTLRGLWEGLRVLQMIYHALFPLMKARGQDCLQLTKQSGK